MDPPTLFEVAQRRWNRDGLSGPRSNVGEWSDTIDTEEDEDAGVRECGGGVKVGFLQDTCMAKAGTRAERER